MPAMTLGGFKALFRFEPGSAPFLRIRRADGLPNHTDVDPPAVVRPKRPRSVSAEGVGRGTGRGGKAPAAKLTRLLKPKGKRAAFVRFIGDRTVTMDQLSAQFGMSYANVNGYLVNIWKDHGIGYEKEGGMLRLILPAKTRWSNIWSAPDGA